MNRRVVLLRRLAKLKRPMTAKELAQTRAWLNADWESHDCLGPDERALVRRLLDTIDALQKEASVR